jgi:hypothetical protein
MVPLIGCEIDAVAKDTIWPITGRTQVIAPFKITIDGVELPHHQRLFGAWVEESIGGPPAFSIPVIRRSNLSGTIDIGNTLTKFGPPGGGVDVTVDGIYIPPSGPLAIRLVTGGRIISATNQPGSPTDDVLILEGGGRTMAYDQQQVDVVYPTGHGLPRAEQADRIFDDIGNSERAFGELGRDQRGYKELQLIGAIGYDAAAQILRAGGYSLYEDRDGLARAFDLVPVEIPAPDWTFDGNMILNGSIEESSNANGPPRVKLTTTKQNLAGEGGGYSSVVSERVLRDIYAPRLPDAQVIGEYPWSLVDSGLTQPAPVEMEIFRQTDTETRFLGVLTAKESIIKTWYDTEIYFGYLVELMGGTVIFAVPGRSVDTQSGRAVEGLRDGEDIAGASLTQSAGTATFTTDGTDHEMSVGMRVLVYGADQSEYNKVTVVLSTPTSTTFTYPVDAGATSPATGSFFMVRLDQIAGERYQMTQRATLARDWDEDGYLIRETEDVYGWLSVEAPISCSHTTSAMSEVTFDDDNVVVRYDGRGMKAESFGQDLPGTSAEAYESFQRTQRTITLYEVNAEGFIESERKENYRWSRQGGIPVERNGDFIEYTYSDGLTSYRPTAEFALDTIEEITYQASESGTLITTRVLRDGNGQIIVGNPSESVTNFGYLPAAEKLPTIPDPAEFPNAQLADREDQQDVIAEVSSEELLTVREDWTLEVSEPLAEDETEATVLARLELVEQNAAQVSVTVPMNLVIRAGQWCRVDLRALDFDRTVRADTVRHEEVNTVPPRFLTVVSGTLFVVT